MPAAKWSAVVRGPIQRYYYSLVPLTSFNKRLRNHCFRLTRTLHWTADHRGPPANESVTYSDSLVRSETLLAVARPNALKRRNRRMQVATESGFRSRFA